MLVNDPKAGFGQCRTTVGSEQSRQEHRRTHGPAAKVEILAEYLWYSQVNPEMRNGRLGGGGGALWGSAGSHVRSSRVVRDCVRSSIQRRRRTRVPTDEGLSALVLGLGVAVGEV